MADAPATTPAASDPTHNPLTASQFKRLRSVTLPVLKMVPRRPKYIMILDAMHLGKEVDKDKGPATIVHALDMESGEEGLFICPRVMQNELIEGYPDHSYVGRGFEVSLTRVPDKRYNIVSLAEVAVPELVQRTGDALRKAAAENKRATEAADAAKHKPNGNSGAKSK